MRALPAGLSHLPWMLVVAVLVASAGADDKLPAARGGSPAYRGALSCSAAGCHGRVVSAPTGDRQGEAAHTIRGDEYYVWAQSDPHAEAYQALFSEQSERMISQLARAEAGSPGNPAAEDYQQVWQRCLACHTASAPAASLTVEVAAGGAVRVEVASPLHEGVGCEACHGSAEGEWFRAHSRPGWRNRSPAERQQMGLQDTTNLLIRARLCAACHVGGQGRDVNHDLLAAGHPAMRFELAGYSEYLVKHWNDERERRAVPEFEWRLWAAGQIATCEAALEQLRERARPTTPRPAPPVWPEFAEYRCDACHQDLERHQAWRTQRGLLDAASDGWSQTIKPGARVLPEWEQWYNTLPRILVTAPLEAHDAGGARIAASIGGIRRHMQVGFIPDRERVAGEANATVFGLREWLERPEIASWLDVSTRAGEFARLEAVNPPPPGAARLAQALLAQDEALVDSWDVAVQVYLMISAWERTLSDERRFRDRQPRANEEGAASGEHQAVRNDLRRLRELLALPPHGQSPSDFAGPVGAESDNRSSRRSQVLHLLRSALGAVSRAPTVPQASP